jgi:hypothetical protein
MENPHCFCCKGIPNVDVSLQPTCNNEVIAPAVPRTNRKLSNLSRATMYLYGDSDLERYKNLKKSFKLGFCKSMEVMKSKEQEVVIDREDLQ